jgi:hypothetical protein
MEVSVLTPLPHLPAGKSLPVPHLVHCTQIRRTVMHSKSPVAEENLGLRPCSARTTLRSRPLKPQRCKLSGAKRPVAPIWKPPRASFPPHRATAAMSSGTQESSRKAQGTAPVPDNGQGVRGSYLPSEICIAQERRRAIPSDNGRPQRAARMPSIGL